MRKSRPRFYHRFKQRVYDILAPEKSHTWAQRLANSFLVALILANSLAVILETVSSIYLAFPHFFHLFDTLSILVFSLEYVLRIWTSDLNPKYRHLSAFRSRLKYLVSLVGLIDFMAIFPYYMPFIHGDSRFLLLMRLGRFVSFFKLARYRYSRASKVLVHVILSKKDELILVFATSLLLMVISSCLMYFVEHTAQPEAFSSIPATMWWAVSTFTTIGYGDIVPITSFGKALASVFAVIGMGMFALPAGILASGFSSVIKEHRQHELAGAKEELHFCPYCGKALPHPPLPPSEGRKEDRLEGRKEGQS